MKIKKVNFAMTTEKKILVMILMVATLSVATALSVQAIFDPQRQAERKLDELATEYYSTYLYPRLLGTNQNAEQVLSELEQPGTAMTYLRQILLYNNQAHREDAVYFSNARYSCDTNHTGVRFYPEPPYGPEDFHTEVFWECQKL